MTEICKFARLAHAKGECTEGPVCVCDYKKMMVFIDDESSLQDGCEKLCTDCEFNPNTIELTEIYDEHGDLTSFKVNTRIFGNIQIDGDFIVFKRTSH